MTELDLYGFLIGIGLGMAISPLMTKLFVWLFRKRPW